MVDKNHDKKLPDYQKTHSLVKKHHITQIEKEGRISRCYFCFSNILGQILSFVQSVPLEIQHIVGNCPEYPTFHVRVLHLSTEMLNCLLVRVLDVSTRQRLHLSPTPDSAAWRRKTRRRSGARDEGDNDDDDNDSDNNDDDEGDGRSDHLP